jgi:hypothetical protein
MYGWGLVNVGASLQPIGGLNVGTKTGAVVSYAGASIASSKAGQASGLKGVSAVAVDKFNRGFVVNLSSAVSGASVTTSSTPTSAAPTVSANGAKFSAEYAPVSTTQNLWSATDTAASNSLGKVSYSFANDRGTSYGFGTGGTAASFFGLQSTGLAPLSLNGEGSRFNAPFFELAESATHFGYGTTFKDGTVLRVGMLSQGSSEASTLQNLTTPVVARSLATMEVQKTFGTVTSVMTIGQLQENNSVLGMTGTGALGLSTRASTTFVTLAGSVPVAAKTMFSAMATLGRTAAYDNASTSLIDGASASNSLAWSLGLSRQDILRDGDKLGFTVSMPLRTSSGTMHMTTAVTQSQEDGSLQYATQSVNLQPTGMERDLELAYSRPMRFGGQLSALVQAKLQPGHYAQAPTQMGLGVKYVRSFK